MKNDQLILSPAKRAKRCLLNLLVCFIVAAGTYLAFHADRSPFKGKEQVTANLATSQRGSMDASATSTAAKNEHQRSLQGRSSIERALASVVVAAPKN